MQFIVSDEAAESRQQFVVSDEAVCAESRQPRRCTALRENRYVPDYKLLEMTTLWETTECHTTCSKVLLY